VTLEFPWGLLAAGIVPPIVLLYVLRGVRRRRVVPSIQLWEGEAREITAHARWRFPPLEVLLVLQIAFVLLGALALSGPAVPGEPRNDVVVVLDASASMQATDGRFDEARRLALQAIDRVAGLGDVTVIRAASTPSVVYDGPDLGVARNALSGITPGGAPSDMQAAIDVAAAMAAKHAEDRTQVVVVSDGAYGPLRDAGVLRAPVRFLLVGGATADIGLTSVVARRNTATANTVEGLVSIANNAPRAVDVPVHATADGVPLETRIAHIEAGAEVQVVFNLPPGTARFGVNLDTGDLLSLDDGADTTVESATRRKVALVGTPSASVAAALRALSYVDLTVVAPDEFPRGASDLVVFERYLPDALPTGPIVVVQPPPGSRLVDAAGETNDLEATANDLTDSLLAGVDVGALRFSGAGLVRAPVWAETVLASGNIPLLLQGQIDGRRVVVLGFDPDQAQLQQTAALPALIANTVSWVTAPLDGVRYTPGEPVTLAVPAGASHVDVQRPDGSVGRAELRGTTAIWRDTDALGAYVARAQIADATQTLLRFDIRLPENRSINIAPVGHAELEAPGEARSPVAGAPRELWPWLVLAAATVCAAEWWYFGRHG
jgi:Ca-activated chloride channel family protein